MIRIAITGVCGKMGKRIATLASRDREFSIVGATEVQGCSLVGVNLGKELKTSSLGAVITDDLGSVIEKCDCVIDFTVPEAALANVKVAQKYEKPVVIGTTGFSREQVEQIKLASKDIPILLSPNMSLAVNVIFDITEKIAKALGKDYGVKMEEAHHIHKKDKPSGTAKLIAEIIKKARNDAGEIAIESIRQGEIVGDHKIVFDSEFDTLEIIHRAKTRDIFAKGALEGAKFIVKKKKGLYSMKDVLEGI